jgi:hypothetical protein
MLNKKKNKDLKPCPFTGLKKQCTKDCMLFREGTYVNELTEETIPFKDCAINIIANNVEAMHNRAYTMQKEVGDLKNVIGLQMLQGLGMVKTPEFIRQAENLLNKSDSQIAIEAPDEKLQIPENTDEGNES